MSAPGDPRPEFELRRFRATDADAVWSLHDAALDDAGVHGGHGPWEDDLRDIPATYLDAGGEFLVALVGGRLIGMGGLLPRERGEAEVKRMRVHPDFQRQGLGRALLAELEVRARELGFRAIVLDTTVEQVAAQRLYKGAGYDETGRRNAGRFQLIDYRKSVPLLPT